MSLERLRNERETFTVTAPSESGFQRLALAKWLLEAAGTELLRPPPFYAMALLNMHDSIELFLGVAVELFDVRPPDHFMGYWGELDKKMQHPLSHKAAMKRLNKARTGLKHEGLLPTIDEVQGFHATTTSFFEDAAPGLFGIEFAAISLVQLISLEEARARLAHAERELSRNDFRQAMTHVAVAFDAAIREYREAHFADIDDPIVHARAVRGLELETSPFGPSLHDLGLHDTMDQIQEAITLLAVGIDYVEYIRLKQYWPGVFRPIGRDEPVVSYEDRISPSEAECRRSFAFVVECCLTLQSRLKSRR